MDLMTDLPFLFNKQSSSNRNSYVIVHLSTEQAQKHRKGCHKQQA